MHETAYLKRKDNSMKKYEKPLLDIIEFENLDVIMLSEQGINEESPNNETLKEKNDTVSDTQLETSGETTSTTVPETPEATPMEPETNPLETHAPEVSMPDSVVEPTESVDVPEVTDISEEADPGVL